MNQQAQYIPNDPSKTEAWRKEVAAMLRTLANRVEIERDLLPLKIEQQVDEKCSLAYSAASMKVVMTFIPS